MINSRYRGFVPLSVNSFTLTVNAHSADGGDDRWAVGTCHCYPGCLVNTSPQAESAGKKAHRVSKRASPASENRGFPRI
jgi:hypothetical protein